MPRPLLAAALLVLVTACAPVRAPAPTPRAEDLRGRDHPLAGRIWDVGAGRFIDAAMLSERLARSRFVLLGEKHDNPEHHRLQASLLQAMVAAGRRPAVGFEMLTMDQAPALARHLAWAPGDAAGLGDAVEWKRSGWPPWELYEPIARVALAARLPIAATDLGRAAKDAVRRQGLGALPAALVALTGLNRPLAAETRAAMAAEIRDAHCGHAPEAMLDAMIAAQRARDAQMAERLTTAGGADGAVLIAGAGHGRKDWGVPVSLALVSPGATVISVAF
ncbi:MAG: ChaN family lipoprotein, partial [Candidatus Rokubacteria bacterium]|nr:ChaN family lipoprotein [Candidatus Rokubacteria bacterium]